MGNIQAKHLQTGELGEAVAVKWLQSNDFFVLEQNARNRSGEIDIIAYKKNLRQKILFRPHNHIHFIEVKTVTIQTDKPLRYQPLDNITAQKIHKLHKAITTYLSEHSLSDMSWQLDAILVKLHPDSNATVEYIEHISEDA